MQTSDLRTNKTLILRYIPRVEETDECIRRWAEAEDRESSQGVFKCVLEIMVGTEGQQLADEALAEHVRNRLAERNPKWRRVRVTRAPCADDPGSTGKRIAELVGAILNRVEEQRNDKDAQPRRTILWWDGTIGEWAAAGSFVSALVEGVNWLERPGGPWQPLVSREMLDQLVGPIARRFNPDRLPKGLIGSSRAMQKVRADIEMFAPYTFPVLLVGETGTGKDVVANLLHKTAFPDDRTGGEFVAVNGALLSEALGPSDLFGHVRGAFTGADRSRKGRLEDAEGGTFFLDELSSTPLSVQAKLLRALQKVSDGVISVEPVGAGVEGKGASGRTRDVKVRLISAAQSTMGIREDLLHRVADLVIELPPLRHRLEDLDELASAILRTLNTSGASRHGALVGPDSIRPAAMQALREHEWPGNVRELQRVLRAAWVRARSDGRTSIMPKHIVIHRTGDARTKDLPEPVRERAFVQGGRSTNLRAEVAACVQRAVDEALQRHDNIADRAALELGFASGQKMKAYRESMKTKAAKSRHVGSLG